MDEVFPVLAGVVVGLVIPIVVSPSRLRWLVLVVLSVVLGSVATWVSGELAISAVYLLVDITQVLGAARAPPVPASTWRRRSAAQSVCPPRATRGPSPYSPRYAGRYARWDMASTSLMTSTTAGLFEARAFSSAGRMSSGRSTRIPTQPIASATRAKFTSWLKCHISFARPRCRPL